LTEEVMSEDASKKNGEFVIYIMFLLTSTSYMLLITSLNQLFRDWLCA